MTPPLKIFLGVHSQKHRPPPPSPLAEGLDPPLLCYRSAQ